MEKVGGGSSRRSEGGGGRGDPPGPPQPRTVAVAPATSCAVGGVALTGRVPGGPIKARGGVEEKERGWSALHTTSSPSL